MHSHRGYMNTPQPCNWDTHKQRAAGFTLRGGEWHGDSFGAFLFPNAAVGKIIRRDALENYTKDLGEDIRVDLNYLFIKRKTCRGEID